MPCSARPYITNTEPPTTIPAVAQVTPRPTPPVTRAKLGVERGPAPKGSKGNFASPRGAAKLPLLP